MSKIYTVIFHLFVFLLSASFVHAKTLQFGFKLADQELNQVYRKAMKRLGPEEQKRLKKSELQWIAYKDYLCEYQKNLNPTKLKSTAENEYLECLISLTKSRTQFLKAYAKPQSSQKRVGNYMDSYGGILKVQKSNSKSMDFELSVVRGPTAHIGELKSQAKVTSSNQAVYNETVECLEIKGPCCQIKFQFEKNHAQLKAQHCSYMHGAKAYFDGLYVKVSP